MAVEDYDNNGGIHHLRRDVHDAHTNSQLAKLLSWLALAGAVLALALSLWALDKAGEAQSNANRALETSQQTTR
ncbi:hypothetical protein CYG49_00270 [Candidatus Saccharibacteria bacterium]|nr:MAG: hypothetical protein CYG49_00270 [Candidatus Saccharibacteria bacterium]